MGIKNQAERIGDPQLLTMLWKIGNPMNQHGCQLSVSKAIRNHVTSLTWQRTRRYSYASGGECRRTVQSNGRLHSSAQVPWTNLTSCSAGLKWRAPSSTDGLPSTSYLAERCDKLWESQVKSCLTKGGVTTFDVTSLVEGWEYHFLRQQSGGLGTFVEMSQAVMPVKEPGMFVLYFSVCQA